MTPEETRELLTSLGGCYQSFRTNEASLEVWHTALRHIEYPAIRQALAEWVRIEPRAPQGPKAIAEVAAKYRVRAHGGRQEHRSVGLRATPGQCDIEDAMDAFGGFEVTNQIAQHLGIDMATFRPHEISKIVGLFKDPAKLQAYKDFRSNLGRMARETLRR